MTHNERVIPYINPAYQLCADLKAIDATFTDLEPAMTILINSLVSIHTAWLKPKQFQTAKNLRQSL